MTTIKGFWRTRNNSKAEVVDVRENLAIGWVGNSAHQWTMNRCSVLMYDFDLIEPWIDKPEWDWSTTPPWLNWLAMDEGGFWYLYGNKPTLRSGTFTTALADVVWFIPKQYAPKWSGHWRDSLVGRPGVDVKL